MNIDVFRRLLCLTILRLLIVAVVAGLVIVHTG